MKILLIISILVLSSCSRKCVDGKIYIRNGDIWILEGRTLMYAGRCLNNEEVK